MDTFYADTVSLNVKKSQKQTSTKGSPTTFISWKGLAKSIKPLYIDRTTSTQILQKQWAELKITIKVKKEPIDSIVHPSKTEATIWVMKEFERPYSVTTSQNSAMSEL